MEPAANISLDPAINDERQECHTLGEITTKLSNMTLAVPAQAAANAHQTTPCHFMFVLDENCASTVNVRVPHLDTIIFQQIAIHTDPTRPPTATFFGADVLTANSGV